MSEAAQTGTRRACAGEELLTTGQAARLLGCSASTIRAMIRSGRLPGWRIDESGHWRITRRAVERLLAAMRRRLEERYRDAV